MTNSIKPTQALWLHCHLLAELWYYWCYDKQYQTYPGTLTTLPSSGWALILLIPWQTVSNLPRHFDYTVVYWLSSDITGTMANSIKPTQARWLHCRLLAELWYYWCYGKQYQTYPGTLITLSFIGWALILLILWQTVSNLPMHFDYTVVYWLSSDITGALTNNIKPTQALWLHCRLLAELWYY